jgi:hypothetical protein
MNDPRRAAMSDLEPSMVAASQLLRWIEDESETGADALRLCKTMVSVGSIVAAGPERSFDWRSGWADWLRTVADEIEAGRAATSSERQAIRVRVSPELPKHS